jgi:transcriptional regulator with XRE-family HTH domain
MITNERQYKIAKASLRGFREALHENKQATEIDPLERETNINAIGSEIETLEKQLRAYDDFKSGACTYIPANFMNLGEALTLARVATKLTQKRLAERIGVRESQIQRYEANGYAQASLARLQEVILALDCNIRMFVRPVAMTNAGKAQRSTITVTDNPSHVIPARALVSAVESATFSISSSEGEIALENTMQTVNRHSLHPRSAIDFYGSSSVSIAG